MTGPMTTRRAVVFGAGAWLLCRPDRARGAEDPFAAIEARVGGRLGVSALDTGSGARLGHREDERFAMCSTFKMGLAAAILARVERGEVALNERIPVRAEDLVTYAPVTEKHVGGSLTVADLCEAVMLVSDNAAANLLLGRIGGPEGWTAFVRSTGDTVSRLDRTETELNTNLPGDPRDTTSPSAMADTLRNLVLGDVLEVRSRARMVGWMVKCKTGRDRLRGGLPSGYRAGDKTGTSGNGAANDIAIVWPPGRRAPWVIAAYYDLEASTGPERNAVLADVARAVVTGFV